VSTAQVTAVTPLPEDRPALAAPPCVFVVFGASGDLTRRKLMPAIAQLSRRGILPRPFAMVGVARRDYSDASFRDDMHAALGEHAHPAIDPAAWERFAPMLHYITGEFREDATYQKLKQCVDGLDRTLGLQGNRLFYLATPPSEFGPILQQLKAANLIGPPGPSSWTRVVVEKPLGRDLESAKQLNDLIAQVLDESQIFRIDHYLGKETVQNILVLRFANSIFEPLWNRKYVDHVEITAAETEGVGTRAAFYEQTGVLRDVVQNHLLEMLSLTAMEPPISGGADDIRSEKLKVLNALRDPLPEDIERDVVLGQYRGYRDEPGVARDSVTPTFAALRVFVDNWRWQGVPFCLRAGKKLANRVTEIALFFQSIPLSLFGKADSTVRVDPNVLTMRIQPDEGIQLRVSSKVPGQDVMIGSVELDMKYLEAFGGEPPEAYERLLMDAMRGDATLFQRRDAVEASWAWLTPILRHVEARPPRDFPNYEPGSEGPAGCAGLKRRAWGWRPL